MEASSPNSLADYYLKIQALTPVGEVDSTTSVSASSNSFQIPTLSIVIFLAVLVLGAFALLLTKSHQINKMLVLLVMAFVLSSVPLTLNSLSIPTGLESQASPQSVPKNVTVSSVSPSGFILTWETDQPESGAIRLSLDSKFESGSQTLVEAEGKLTTSHQLTITSLKPRTLYYFQLLSGSMWYEDQDKPLEVKTPGKP
jgi:hypothetical protein